MDDLVRWLSAQYDKDERIARAAIDAQFITCAEWHARGPYGDGDRFGNIQSDNREQIVEEDLLWPHAVHFAAWDPARALREIDAKRKLLADVLSEPHFMSADDHWNTCPTIVDEDGVPVCLDESRAPGPCDCGRDARVARRLLLLALPYADRPGYAEAIASAG